MIYRLVFGVEEVGGFWFIGLLFYGFRCWGWFVVCVGVA
jgi:hypothetical protein